MMRSSIILVLILACTTSFAQTGSKYGAYADPSTFTELTLFSDSTFLYYEQFELGKPFKCTGKWTMHDLTVVLYNCDNHRKKMPLRWDFDENALISKAKKKNGRAIVLTLIND